MWGSESQSTLKSLKHICMVQSWPFTEVLRKNYQIENDPLQKSDGRKMDNGPNQWESNL